MKKHMKLFIALAIILLITISFIFVKSSKENNFYKESTDNIKKRIIQESTLSMMLETEEGSGNYEMTTATSWPTDGYVFNSTLSKCENGGELSWDDEKKVVLMSGNVSDKCYVYFDKYVSHTLADFVISQYNGVQGNNNIYYHDSSLENGTGDNSYRYAGASDSVNNYVCFGTNTTPCPEDNLYRIIGVFNEQVKLIKATEATSSLLGTNGGYLYDNGFLWSTSSSCPSSTTAYTENQNIVKLANKNIIAAPNPTTDGCNNWKYSELNTINLNTNYLNSFDVTWINMIEDSTWKVSGHTAIKVTPSEMYIAEIKNATSTYGPSDGTAKIGLMYVSDYGFAAAPSAWTKVLSYNSESGYSDSTVTSVNWMYISLDEWTITPSSSDSYSVFYLTNQGFMAGFSGHSNWYGIRPVFYLKSSVLYKSGIGTSSDAIYITD